MTIKLTLFGRDHTIFIDDEKLKEACENNNIDDPEYTTGLFVADAREIYVSTAQEPEDVVQTLLHETLHAIGHITGHVQLTHSTRKNEAFINAIASGILDLLKSKEVFATIKALLGHDV